ncbi:MAG: hypothetical protein R2706_06090 [Acidimicrobiales bacterium]
MEGWDGTTDAGAQRIWSDGVGNGSPDSGELVGARRLRYALTVGPADSARHDDAGLDGLAELRSLLTPNR